MIIVVYIALGLLGLCMGSFVNALVWRLHEQGRRKKPDARLSIMKGRSMCPHCKHTLAAWDLIPLFSWLSLGGRCRYCEKPIGWHYPAVELGTAALFMLSYAAWPFQFTTAGWMRFGVWLVILTAFMALVVYDLRWMLLPDKIVYTILALVTAQMAVLAVLNESGRVLLISLWGALVLGGLFYVLFQLSGGKWIGGGDVKLGFVLGLLVGGPGMSILLLFLASSTGTLISMPLILAGKAKRTSRIPFGPFLIFAAVIVQLFGVALSDWYQQLFL